MHEGKRHPRKRFVNDDHQSPPLLRAPLLPWCARPLTTCASAVRSLHSRCEVWSHCFLDRFACKLGDREGERITWPASRFTWVGKSPNDSCFTTSDGTRTRMQLRRPVSEVAPSLPQPGPWSVRVLWTMRLRRSTVEGAPSDGRWELHSVSRVLLAAAGKCCYFLDLWAFACSISHVPTRMTRLNRASINL